MNHVLALTTAAFYLVGIMLAVSALWRSRTSQGATAWIVALLAFPFLSVPAFLLFGRNKFHGYVRERKELDDVALRELGEARAVFDAEFSAREKELAELTALALKAHQPGFTVGNEFTLLVNGERTYDEMLKAIDAAQKYILFQFYIFRPDESGRRFKEALCRKAREGVRVYFLYDRIGTGLDADFVREMTEAGVEAEAFRSTKSIFSDLQVNFRNHRKLLVVDGASAFVGGINIGDDYLGKWESIGPWRDTHVKCEGPSAVASQLSFIKDWYWATNRIPDLDWVPRRREANMTSLVLHTGPADEGEACLLAHLAFILSAKSRVWISNPYFVPPEGLVNALMLASLKGVDVRILIPSYSDNRLVMLASQLHVEKLSLAGVKFFRYMPGFLHQKVMLVDHQAGLVGSVNLDARSLFVNFEILAVSTDARFVNDLEKMLLDDFRSSEQVTLEMLAKRSRLQRFAGRAANLFAPVL